MINTLYDQWQKTVGGLPGTFWVLWWGTLVNRLGAFVAPFLALYLSQQLGDGSADLRLIGLVATAYGAGQFVSHPVGGWLTDRVGRKQTLMASFFGTFAMMTLLAFGLPVWAIVALAFPLGFIGDLYRPAMKATVADLVPLADRTRAYGLIYWAINLGFAAAPALAGLLAESDYRYLFAGDGVTTLVFGLLIWRLVPETRPDSATSSGPVSLRSYREPLSDPAFMAYTGLVFLTALVMSQAYTTLPLDMLAKGFSEADYGRVIAVNGIVVVLLGVPATRLLPLLPRFGVMAVSALLVGLGFGLMPLTATIPTLAAAIVVWTLGEIVGNPVSSNIVADLAPESRRGVYMGAFGASWGLAHMLAPLVGTTLLESFGSGVLWGTCGVLGAVAAVGFVVLGAPLARRTAPVAVEMA